MTALRELYTAHRNRISDVREAQQATAKDIGKWLDTGKIKPADMSIREMFDVLVLENLRARGSNFDLRFSDFDEIKEEISSSAFPYATGKLISPTVLNQYELDTTDIRSLFTETESNARTEDVVGFTDGDRPRHVEENEPYPEASLNEKRVQISNQKFGQGIALTVEAIRFDKTGELANRARNVGTYIADLLEEFACYRLSDVAWPEINETTSKAFVYGGTAQTVFADTHAGVDGQVNDNLVAAGNGGPSISQARTMENLLKAMKSERGRPVRIRPTTIFAHSQLESKLDQFFNRQDFDLDSAERNVNVFKSKYRIITSQFFPSTSYWYMGDPAKQSVIQWVWRPKVATQSQGDPKRDILVSYWVSMFVGIGLTDYRYVVRNNG